MKKFIGVILFSIFLMAVLGSCKSKDCPAYSQVGTTQAENNA